MTRLFVGILLIFTAVAQSTVLSLTSLLGIAPNLVLVIILVWSSLRGAREGVIWAFAAGLMLDLLALDPLGSNALALLAVALVGSLARRPLLQSGLMFSMVMVVLATIVHFLIASVIDIAVGAGYSLLISIRLGFLTAFLNMLTVPPIYGLVVLLDHMGVRRVAQA